MYFMSFLFACYLVQWSVGLLQRNSVAGPIGMYSVFGIGLLAVPVAAWTGIHLIMN